MRIWIAWILFAGFGTGAASAQTQPQPPVARAQDGGMRSVLESIVIPPIPNAPFSATLATEWKRYTADGGTITMVNERHIARDEQGRIYEERWLLVPKGGTGKSMMNWIQIADPGQQTLLNCSVFRHICTQQRYDPRSDLAAATGPIEMNGPLGNGRGFIHTDRLGMRLIAGVETTGTRITSTLSPGAIGNDQPVNQVRETWHSDQLGINLLSVVSGPLVGTETFTVTEIDPSPPDPRLFQIPQGYQFREPQPGSSAEQ